MRQVELWYLPPGGSWNAVETIPISGKAATGSFSPHTPTTAGTNYYGIHVVDTAWNWDSEGSAGPKTVEVTAPTQGQSIITSITPASGVKGMAITINGRNFGTKPGTVLFGDTPAKLGQPNDDYGYLKWSDTKIVALVPIGVGTVHVNVKESKGTISNGVPFNYLDVPIVSQWRWPRDKAISGQKYANPYSPSRLHTGIDVYETPNNLKGSVFAAADGIVVAKCPTDQKCQGFSTTPTNHVLMGVVIIAHRLSDGTLVYSMYGDMADVSSSPEPGEQVHMGDLLGQTGIVAGSFGPVKHVHFEIKNEPVLNNPSWIPNAKTVYWGYTPTNPDDYGYRNPKSFVNLLQPPAPTLSSPINGAKVSITPTMSWSSDTQSYRIQGSSNNVFTNIVFDQSDIITTSITIPALNHKTKYWWRVDARNSGGLGLWSNVRSFTTV